MLERFQPAAVICSVLANVNRDPDAEPYSPEMFMPGGRTREQIREEEMREFAESVARGDIFEVDKAAALAFRQQMEGSFRNVRSS